MKPYGIVLGLLATAMVVCGTTVLAHEECGDDSSKPATVDAQAACEGPKVYANLRTAASHMAMIADPLGMAIAKQFPERFAQR